MPKKVQKTRSLREVYRIIYEGTVPSDWNLSFIINLFKGKGDALLRGNYRGLKLQEQAMKIMEHVLNAIIRQIVVIDEMQFGFMTGRSTTDAIFILRQLQEKYDTLQIMQSHTEAQVVELKAQLSWERLQNKNQVESLQKQLEDKEARLSRFQKEPKVRF